MMQDLGLISKLPRIVRRPGGARQPALPRLPRRTSRHFEPITAQKTLASAIQIGNPVSVEGRSARCSSSTASSSRPASRSWPTRRRAPTAPACSTARTPAWRWPRSSSWSSARSSSSSERVVVISTANGLKFADQKAATTWARSTGIKPTHRNLPVELPAGRQAGRRAPSRATSSGRGCWCRDGQRVEPQRRVASRRAAPDRAASRTARHRRRARRRAAPEARARARHARSCRPPPTPSPNTQELKDHFEGTHRARGVRPLRQPHPAHRRGTSSPRSRAPEACLLFASGMAAMTTTLFAMLVARHARGRHRRLLPPHAAVPEPDAAPLRHRGARRCRRATTRRSRTRSGPTTRVLVSESPTNPYNRILDLERFADIGRRHRVKTVDRRHLRHALQPAPARVRRRPRPALGHQVPGRPQRPPGGRGARLGRAGRRHPRAAGRDRAPSSTRSPPTCWSAGSRRFALRMERQNANAQAIAEFLAAHPRIAARALRGLAEPSRARHRPEADAGLRRRGLLRGGGRSRRGDPRWSTRCRIPHIAAVARRRRRA